MGDLEDITAAGRRYAGWDEISMDYVGAGMRFSEINDVFWEEHKYKKKLKGFAGEERFILAAIEKSIFTDLCEAEFAGDFETRALVGPLIVSGYLEGWEDIMYINNLRHKAEGGSDNAREAFCVNKTRRLEAEKALENLLGGHDDEMYYRSGDAYTNWALMARNHFERVSKMLYEGMFFIGSEELGSVYHLRGHPAFDAEGVLYWYYNPFLVTSSTPKRGAHVAEVLASLPPFVTFEQVLKPDNVDIASSFYKGRVFYRLLEVDNSLVLPYATNIKLSITADDVIHS